MCVTLGFMYHNLTREKVKLNHCIIIMQYDKAVSALLLCFQDKPGTCVPAGLQGGLQNPVSREEGQMRKLQ